MKIQNYTFFVLFVCILLVVNRADAHMQGGRYFVGTSAFTLVNLDTSAEEPPRFYQINFGYQLSTRDTLSIEFITWRYYAPLGAPIFGDAADSVTRYPGSVRSLGAALAYQRFFWRGFYAAVHTAFFRQNYLDQNDNIIQNGFQIFIQSRIGYHIAFGKTGFFIEPSAAMTSWPVNNGLPADFLAEDRKWKRIQFEPGLHLGWVF